MKRIYLVRDSEEQTAARLIRAASKAQAIGHAARNRYSAEVPSQETLVALVSAGVKVEDITPSQEEAAPAEAGSAE